MTAIAEHTEDLFGLMHHHEHFNTIIINQTLPWGEDDQVGVTFYPFVAKKSCCSLSFHGLAWICQSHALD